MTHNEFIEKIAYYVQQFAYVYGIEVHSPIIAQAILESGWGESKLASKYHNYFGLKCGSKWKGKSVNMQTQEEYEVGTLTTIRDNFRVFNSMEDGVKGYFDFIQLPRYHNLRGITDPRRYLETIKADGYATSSSYVDNNMRIINQYNLTQYDRIEVTEVSKIEQAVQWMINTANDNHHGYDQRYRWGEKGDYDCSSAVITAWETAGVPVKSKGATYTGNMLSVFKKCGFTDVISKVNVATGAGLQRGDVLLNSTHHTAMYIGNGQEVEASINEKGTAVGGAPGDQTGREFLIRSYRNFPWNHVLRYTAEAPSVSPEKSVDQVAREVLAGQWGNGDDRKNRLQSAGYNYAEVQARVNQIAAQPKPTPRKSNSEIANEVLAGKWGNGNDRKNALERAGYDYNAVQAEVNNILSPNIQVARDVIAGKYGNGEDRKRRLRAAGYDPDAVQRKVNELLK